MRPVRIVLNVMPSAASWRASVLNAASVAARCELESISTGIGSRTEVDETLRMRPKPRSRMPGTVAWISAIGASTRSRYASSHCSRPKARASGFGGGPPVLVTSTSTGPRRSSTLRTSQGAPSRPRESCTNGSAPISAAVSSIRSRDREATATVAPSRASASAMPRPMPFDAPVTSATDPSSARSIARDPNPQRRLARSVTRRSIASASPLGGRTVTVSVATTRRDERSGAPLRLVVLAEHLAHDAADLADRGLLGQGVADRVEQVPVGLGGLAELAELGLQLLVVAVRLELLQPVDLLLLRLRVDAQDLDVVDLVGDVLVDADDDVLLDPVALLVAPGRLLDLGADERDRLDGAAELLDLVDQVLRALLDLVGQRLDEVGAGERVDRVGGAGLVGQDLLGAQGDAGGALGRQRQRLVEAVRVQRLGAAAHRGEALERDAHDVVLRLLRGQRDAAGLGVESQRLGLRVLRPEALAHDPRPHPAHGAELGHLLEDVVVAVEEERQARAEVVDLEPGVDRALDVGDAVGQRERDLLDRRAALLAHVVAGDRDRVPLRHPLAAVGEQVGGQAHRRLGRVDEVPARDVLLEDVVLCRAAELLRLDALLLADELVEQQQDRRGRVDRHRRRDLVQRDALEHPAHVVDRVDGHAGAPDLAQAERVIGVAAELGRQVEGHREPGRSVLDQVAEALVGLLGRGVARVLAHRPLARAVHVRVDAPGEGELAGLSQPLLEAAADVLFGVQLFDLDAGVGELPGVVRPDDRGDRGLALALGCHGAGG